MKPTHISLRGANWLVARFPYQCPHHMSSPIPSTSDPGTRLSLQPKELFFTNRAHFGLFGYWTHSMRLSTSWRINTDDLALSLIWDIHSSTSELLVWCKLGAVKKHRLRTSQNGFTSPSYTCLRNSYVFSKESSLLTKCHTWVVPSCGEPNLLLASTCRGTSVTKSVSRKVYQCRDLSS